jgi:uncharacterized membrane protein
MEWLFWAILSALFAGATAVLAKIGVTDVDSNLATAIRTGVILLFSWLIALAIQEFKGVRNSRMLRCKTWRETIRSPWLLEFLAS